MKVTVVLRARARVTVPGPNFRARFLCAGHKTLGGTASAGSSVAAGAMPGMSQRSPASSMSESERMGMSGERGRITESVFSESIQFVK